MFAAFIASVSRLARPERATERASDGASLSLVSIAVPMDDDAMTTR